MSNETVIVDRRFQVPPNVIDVRSQNESDGEVYYDTLGPITEPEADFDEGAYADPIATPATFSLVSQTVRSSGGQFVVDVILEIPDQKGVIDYEVRVAKA